MNFQYTVDPYSKEPIILLNKHIGNDVDEGMGIDGAQFQAELMALDSMHPTRIQVWINSVGGGVIDLMSMYAAILHSKTPVDTYDMGMAASSAGVLFQAGRKRYMMDYATLMYHNVHGSDDKKLIGILNDSIGKMTARSGKTEEDIRTMMGKTTYINASEALAHGMCDEVLDSNEHNKKRMSHFTAATEAKSFLNEANAVLNSIITINDKKSMKLVANKLGLTAEASEDSIVGAVTTLQNKLTDAENKAKTDKTELESRVTAAEAKAKTAEDALAALTKEKEDSDDIALTDKCKNMVTGFAVLGKIKNEAKVIDFYTMLAKAEGGFEIVKSQLEDLPVNKVATNIAVAAETAGKKVYTFAGQMGLIANKINSAQ